MLSGCDNFLEGAEAKAQIEEAIAYNNAQSYTIKIDCPENSGVIVSPAGGVVNKKVKDSFNIRFDTSSDYEFICWKIIDTVSKKEFNNGEYFTIDHFDLRETNCHFTKAPAQGMELCLMPVVAERPQIIFNSPVSLNALKDSRIQVLFDRDMDPYSIYFTDEEIQELSKKGIPDKDFLPPLSENTKNHYGYKKDGEVFFKNISIKNEKDGTSLNHCFAAPFFETPRALYISVIDKNKLDDFTQVLVTIEKGFFYNETYPSLEKGKAVEMAGSKRWMYAVNNKTDTLPLTVRIGGQDLFSVKTTEDKELQLEEYLTLDADGENLRNLIYVKDNKLKLDIQVQEREGGSGPSSYFELYATKVYDSNYEDNRVYDDESYQIISPVYYINPLNVYYQTVTPDVGIFKGEVDLSSMNLEDGIYQFYCLFYDKSGNVLEYPNEESLGEWLMYYFAIDNDFSMEEPVITDESDFEVKFKISWQPCIDYACTKIHYKKHDTDDWSEEIVVDREYNSKVISGLELATEYDFEIKGYDFAGHEKEFTSRRASDEWGLFVSGTPEKVLYFEGESFDKRGINVILKNLITGAEQQLTSDEWSVDFDTSDLGVKKLVKIHYTTQNGSSKIAQFNHLFYIAAQDSLTTQPIEIENDELHYKFGDFPQTIAENQVDSYYTETPVYNDCWYLGKDGYFYEKCIENAYTGSEVASVIKYSDGTTVQPLSNNSSKYFKVEPIKWDVITFAEDEEHIKIFTTETILNGNIPYYIDEQDRTISEQTIYPSNYKYSTLRAYLNGCYEEDDTQTQTYKNKGFLQKTFTADAQELILNIPVDNSVSSGFNYNEGNIPNSVINSSYICSDTNDKIFALSLTEESILIKLTNMFKKLNVSDYAKANHAFITQDGKVQGAWLRTPYDSTYTLVSSFGNATISISKVTNCRGIIPMLYVIVE